MWTGRKGADRCLAERKQQQTTTLECIEKVMSASSVHIISAQTSSSHHITAQHNTSQDSRAKYRPEDGGLEYRFGMKLAKL
jgi:hypothetical protein